MSKPRETRPRRTPKVLRMKMRQAARDAVREAIDLRPLPSVDALTDRAMQLLVLGDGCSMSPQRQRDLIKHDIVLFRDGAAFQQDWERREAREKPLNRSTKLNLN